MSSGAGKVGICTAFPPYNVLGSVRVAGCEPDLQHTTEISVLV